ncbi:MAG: ketopantoate reductase family protein [Oscillospiraceae bacterium]|nr:ketopantoate reductase family protein [Oscillospiraceae bacterium]
MRFLVIGAGAIGGSTAAFMTKAGYDVSVLCRSEATAKTLCEKGMHISGVRGDMDIPLKAVCGTEKLEGKFDYCIVSTKAYDTIPAVRSALPLLKEDGLVLVLQNGICVDELLAAAGENRSACGVTSFSSTMVSPTHMKITGEGAFQIGMAAGHYDRRLEALREALSAMVPTEIKSPILSYMYSKLIINSGITCGGALTGQLLGAMLRSSQAREFFIGLVYEDMALAEKMGIKVPPFGGRLDYYKFISGNSRLDRLRRTLMIFVVGLKYKNLKSSSLTSLERGKPTEVQVLNGWISKKAKEYGILTPINDRLVELIHQIEAGQRKSCPENIQEIMENI